jgi:uncharacterized protein
MALNCEWDNDKERKNLKKHGVSFIEAATVFDDPFCLTIDDVLHSTEEYRFLTMGYSNRQRLLVVVHTDRGDNIRIISARVATPSERRDYDQSI